MQGVRLKETSIQDSRAAWLPLRCHARSPKQRQGAAVDWASRQALQQPVSNLVKIGRWTNACAETLRGRATIAVFLELMRTCGAVFWKLPLLWLCMSEAGS
ncbi:hypothetical protein WJX81_007235 [Elliptochloris bilobata]|uniref:Uncharacterized protein n=1 Tax=Elliptochloris bilobata TaxID=381761 RepID=A0AAW1RAG8_9CHLO